MIVIRQLLVFIVGAGCLLAFERAVLPSLSGAFKEPIQKSILIDESVIEVLHKTLVETLGREPKKDEMELSISHHIDNEILVNEALLLGLHRADSVVRQRTLKNMKFVASASASKSDQLTNSSRTSTDDVLLKRADQLGMYRQDIVIRRRLIERMKKIIVSQSDQLASDSDLIEYVDENPEKYVNPVAFRLAHGYFSKSKRSKNEIDSLYDKWAKGILSDEKMQAAADQVLISDAIFVSRKQIDKLFGKKVFSSLTNNAVSEGIFTIQPSVGGFHFLRLIDDRERHPMEMSEIKGRVRQDFQAVHQKRIIESTLLALRGEYSVQR